jgi:hypothetical protein
MWHLKDKIIGFHDSEGSWSWGRVSGKFFERRGSIGFVDVELLGTQGWRTFDIGFNQVITVMSGKVWVWLTRNGKTGWCRCGR